MTVIYLVGAWEIVLPFGAGTHPIQLCTQQPSEATLCRLCLAHIMLAVIALLCPHAGCPHHQLHKSCSSLKSYHALWYSLTPY